MFRKALTAGAVLAIIMPLASAQAQTQQYLDDLTRRLEAMERIMSTVISREEENSRKMEVLEAENRRLAGDLQMRLAQIEEEQARSQQAAAAQRAASVLPAPVAPLVVEPSAIPASTADGLFLSGKSAAQRGDWDRASFDLEAFSELETSGDRWLEAQYLLGRGLMAQGKGAEAAARFLAVYEAGDAVALAGQNLHALTQVLQGMETVDVEQKCALNAELVDKHIASLDAAQLDAVRTSSLTLGC